MHRLLTVTLAALALAAPSAAAAHGGGGHRLPDAEIFATNNTAVISDPDDPRLRVPLIGFARAVERIVWQGGGIPRGSQLLDGVFFSAANFPLSVQPVIQSLPLTALNDALRAVILEAATLRTVQAELWTLIAWGVGSFAIALRIFRWR